MFSQSMKMFAKMYFFPIFGKLQKMKGFIVPIVLHGTDSDSIFSIL